MDDSVGCCSIRLNLQSAMPIFMNLKTFIDKNGLRNIGRLLSWQILKAWGNFPTWESIFPYKGNWAMTLRLFPEIISQNLLRNQNKSSIVLSLKVKIRIAKRWTLLIESVHILHFIRNLGNVCICFAKRDTIIDMRFLTRIFTYRVLKQRLYSP